MNKVRIKPLISQLIDLGEKHKGLKKELDDAKNRKGFVFTKKSVEITYETEDGTQRKYEDQGQTYEEFGFPKSDKWAIDNFKF